MSACYKTSFKNSEFLTGAENFVDIASSFRIKKNRSMIKIVFYDINKSALIKWFALHTKY